MVTSSARIARVVGWLTVLTFAGISTTEAGFYIDFRPPFTRIGPGEANLWLASTLLLFPAACLLGYGHQRRLALVMAALRSQLVAMSSRDRVIGLLCLTGIAVACARLCNGIVLLGFPLTDDEWAARFGGEVLASGQLATPMPFAREAIPRLFSFIRDGKITSLDWLGVQIPWTIAALTGTGNWVFAVAAAVPVPCIVWILSRRTTPGWGVAGALLFLVSPMSFALSMSTHGHLSSRALAAVILVLFVVCQERKSRAASLAMGLALGLALICRPYEIAFLFAPLFLSETWVVWRRNDSDDRRLWLITILGVMLPLLLFFAHAYLLTGSLAPPRHHPLQVGGVPTHEQSYWVRFGSNTAFNALRMAVWFAGPLGVILFAAGVLTDRLTRLLGLGVASVLLLGLFHDNYGIHAVGPIHYSECVVPLTIVAVHGLANLAGSLRALSLPSELPAAITVSWFVVGLGTFNVLHAMALRGQSLSQSIVYDTIEREIAPDQRPAVLLAPSFGEVWTRSPDFLRRGSWVFEWRRPRPDFSDDILILLDSSAKAVASVRAACPERKFFRLGEATNQNLFPITPDL